MDLYRRIARIRTEEDADEIREHLAACEPCLDNFDAEETVKQLVQRCCSKEQAPAALRSRIMSSLVTAGAQVEDIEGSR